jgi:hypothetical protein
MGSSAGRRSAAYVRARREFQSGKYKCWIASGPWCTGIGTTVDHDPPLSAFPAPELWRGAFRPACKQCQDRQGADIRNGRTPHANAWQW